MKKFLVLYKAPMSAMQQMANATAEEAKAGMDAWMAWAKKAGNAVVDLGAPLGNVKNVSEAPIASSSTQAVGYSILQAGSMDAIMELLREHPHGHVPQFSIEVFECLALPSEQAKQPSAA